jgi:DNA-binding IscR family transcriptional regulator
VLEGSLFPTDCVENTSVCNRCYTCATRDVWKKVGDKIIEVLESVTLEKMIALQKNKNEGRNSMYYI